MLRSESGDSERMLTRSGRFEDQLCLEAHGVREKDTIILSASATCLRAFWIPRLNAEAARRFFVFSRADVLTSASRLQHLRSFAQLVRRARARALLFALAGRRLIF